MDFPNLIKTTRESLGETQAEFAKRFASHANTVSRWESGQYQAPYVVIAFVVDNAPVFVSCSHCEGTGRIKIK